MFVGYLKDMKSWILFFLGMLGLADIILWLDQGIAVEFIAVLYFNVLLLLFFVVFLVWRYRVEMDYVKKLSTLVEERMDEWHEALPEPILIRDQVVNESLAQLKSSFAKELSRVKEVNGTSGDYVASWVHEVKAPLTAMKLIIDANRNERGMRKIESDWLRIHLLIDQQLSIARLPTLETDYVLVKTSLQKLVTAEVRELASWCLEKNIAVEFEGTDLDVVTDSKWSRFIIRQLLTNAVKYSPVNGIIIISINLKATGYAELVIKDEGPGIPMHDLPRVFDKGFTGGTGRLYNAATGLGLYLANTVASKIGITLGIKSEVAHGTAMHMTFSKENEFERPLK